MAASTTSGLCSSTTASSALWPSLTEVEIAASAESASSTSARSNSEPTNSP